MTEAVELTPAVFRVGPNEHFRFRLMRFPEFSVYSRPTIYHTVYL